MTYNKHDPIKDLTALAKKVKKKLQEKRFSEEDLRRKRYSIHNLVGLLSNKEACELTKNIKKSR